MTCKKDPDPISPDLMGRYLANGMQGYPLKAGEPRGLPLQFRTLPERLAGLGYRTHLVGKWHQGYHRADYTPTRRGFHHHFGYWNGYMSYHSHVVHMDSANGLKEGRIGLDLHWNQEPVRGDHTYATELFTHHAENVIRDHDGDAGPLFLQVAHLAAHAGLNGTILEVPDEAENELRFKHIVDPNRRRLAGVIRELDLSVGRVVQALERRGMLNDTIIVFMADNGGETLGPHRNFGSNWPLRGQKWTVYEGGVRGVAAVWTARLARPGSIHRDLVHATDWLPTFYEAAGGDVKDLGELDGVSQWAALTTAATPSSPPPRSEVLVNVDEAAALIQGSLKIVKGQQAVDRSVHLGESGRDDYPPYSASEVVATPTARALAAASRRPLTDAAVRGLRYAATVTPNQQPVNLTCTPYCLFDVLADPCESVDLRLSRRQRGDDMLARLAHWERLTVPQLNQPVDEAADPRKHNMTWVSWQEPRRSGAAAACALPLVPVALGLAAALGLGKRAP